MAGRTRSSSSSASTAWTTSARRSRSGRRRRWRTSPACRRRSSSPSTRWFDATLLSKDQVRQKDNWKAMVVFGHGGRTITRMPEAAKGIAALELLVVADPHPTTWAVLGGRKDNTYLLPICTQFECD